MKKDDLWTALVDKHPLFAQPDKHITLTGRGLRRLVDMAWEEGFLYGQKTNPIPRESQDSFNFMDQILSPRRKG
jgi:hypothetical protein